MNHLQEYDVVRVIKLDYPTRHYDGTESVKRQPQLCDLGTIVHISHDTKGTTSWYLVECVDINGFTIWLADFTRDELELVGNTM